MKLVVGLGNPGKKYKKTRHNTGFTILDELRSRISNFQINNHNLQLLSEDWKYSRKAKTEHFTFLLNEGKVELIKPQTMMNNSGRSVAYARNKHKVLAENLYVIHDDLDIKLGEYKIQKGNGPKDHKGLLSIYKELGTKDFWHVRIGVDNREVGNRISGEDYVLMSFADEEMKIFETVKTGVVDELLKLISYN